DLAHAWKRDLRLHGVAHLGPPGEVDLALRRTVGPIGLDVDAIHAQSAAVDREPRAHVGPHRLELADLDEAAVEGRLAVISRLVGDVDVDIRRVDAPGRLVILVRELSTR